MMEVKKIWITDDFENMNWHDSYIHTISFPAETADFAMEIDYMFEWLLNEDSNQYSFWVSPCVLYFNNVSNLTFNLNFEDSIGLYIETIERHTPTSSPNGNFIIWKYIIRTDKGDVSFQCSEFKQIVMEQPILSDSQVLHRGSVSR